MKGKKVGKKAPWESDAGWKAVDIGDDVLIGCDEFGFAGLEELDPSMLGAVLKGGVEPAVGDAGEQQEQQQKPGKGKKQQQKGKKRKAPEAGAEGEGGAGAEDGTGGDAGEGEESLEALKAKLAKLESENQKLKGKKKERQQLRKEKLAQRREAKKAAAAAAAGAADAAEAGEGEAGGAQQAAGKPSKRAKAKADAAGAAPGKQQQQQPSKGKKQQQRQQKEKQEQEPPLVDVSAWRPFQLHSLVEKAVARLGFSAPTQVQVECLPAAVRDRRDVIGAAQTGSGKTLAFGLPIMQLLLQEREQQQQQEAAAAAVAAAGGGEQGEGGEGGATPKAARQGKLRALILAPTRELAMQVCEHLQAVGKVCGIWVVPIVGGISALKQERLLGKRPEVVVATPGRLWDLMKLGQEHVTDLSGLSFLVIDEADRMVQQGHYQELTEILAAIPKPSTQQEAMEEAKAVAAARSIATASQQQEDAGTAAEGDAEGDGDAAERGGTEEEKEEGGEEGDAGEGHEGDAGGEPEVAAGGAGQQAQRGRRRRHILQTFVFSATLTLPANLRKRLRKGGGGATGSASLDSLMDRVPFRAKPKIVDLTSERKLADKVEEAYIECGEAQRDEYLYCILAKHPGRTLVFVNAISSVRRLGAILKLLGLPAHPLHAGMQQRARLKALDRFKSDPNAILVATDVAARGLDVKDVRCVVHYQIPASVDVYVHRSGRTARAEAEGVSIALVTPKESARFLALLRALNRSLPPEFPVDLSLMPAAHKRVRLAVRLDDIARKQSKERADTSWRRQNAEALGIELSDDSGDEEAAEGRRLGKKARRDKGGARGPDEDATAEELRAELSSLLAEPLQPTFSRKFFTGGAAAAVAAHIAPGAAGAGTTGAGGKHGRRKGAVSAAAGQAEDEEGPVGEGEGDVGHAPAGAAATVSEAVQLAQRMSDSRAKAAAEVKAKAAKKKKQQKKKGKEADPRAAALRAALAKQGAKKKGGGGRGLFVIPQAFGRDVAGPDALQALRSKLAAL